ncbi:hypothetical protein [Nonomuraea sp. NPDC046570]|uniref:hypothetical protein n=1 Tax=Nonomuraea sp. NPDC046570 TaxID=3155255 RepID=UPI0033C06630
MTGSDAYLPVMADCERGMGRPERALDLVRSPEAERLDRAGRIELAIVESGARRDLGQHDAAVITLQRLPELRDPQPRPWSARLSFAYADALAEAGHEEAATDWFGRAMAFDDEGETDAAERYAEITGAVIEDLEEEFEDDSDTDADTDADADSDTDFDEAPVGVVEVAGGDVLDDDEEEDELEELEDSAANEVVENDESDDSDDDESGDDESDDDESDDDESDDEGDEHEDDSDEDESDDDGGSAREAVEPVQAEAAAAETPAAGIGPAFIEPNFGDVLDTPDKPDAKDA